MNKIEEFDLDTLTLRQSLSEDFTTGMKFKFEGPAYRFTLAADKRSRKTDDFKLDVITLEQSYFRIYAGGIFLSLNASQTFFKTEKRESTDFSEGLSIDWRPKPNLSLGLNAEMWQREEKEADDKSEEHFWEVGMKLRYFVGKIEISFEYSHLKWGGTSRDRDEDRLTFNIGRKF